MKLVGLTGTGTGKLGSSVFSVNSGVQIVRQYQPVVTNPNSVAQVDQRAKLKLMSQLAASLAPVIVIPKDGLKSSRNQFIAKNFRFVSASNGLAQITIENVQLTNGNAGLPAITATRSEQAGIAIQLSAKADGAVSRVVYIMYVKTSENTLQYVQSVISEASGQNGTFPATMVYTAGEIVLFAYGMKDLSAKASAKYGEMSAASGIDIATLALSRNLNYADYQFTQTRGATMFAGENQIVAVPEGFARLFVTGSRGGSVEGAGTFEIGASVTVVATPESGFIFVGWRNNGSDEIISTDANYTFTLTGSADLIAVFREDVKQVTIQVLSAPSGTGTATGAGTYDSGTAVTFTATPRTGYRFLGWKLQGESSYMSTSNPYTHVFTENATLVAEFVGDDD